MGRRGSNGGPAAISGDEPKKFRWPTPHAWLKEKVAEWDEKELRRFINTIIDGQDADFIQDKFQEEMDKDGYFEEVA